MCLASADSTTDDLGRLQSQRDGIFRTVIPRFTKVEDFWLHRSPEGFFLLANIIVELGLTCAASTTVFF